MKVIARSSMEDTPEAALHAVTNGLVTELGAMCDLALIFLAGHPGSVLEQVAAAIRRDSPQAIVLGVTAVTTLEGASEFEGTASIALWAAHLPGVNVDELRLTQEDLEGPGAWTDRLEAHGEAPKAIMLFADPFSIDIRAILETANTAFRGVPVVGGLASAGRRPGQNALFGRDGLVQEGAVGVALRGAIKVDTLVSQGCRPIGEAWVATKCINNVIHTLRNRPALEVLKETMGALPPEDADLVRKGLFVGRVIDEYKSHHERGDFLIHGLIGADPKTGVIAVAGEARTGMTVQFHLRDAASADEDLRCLLAARKAALQQCRGALLFSCNGRGTHMWDEPNHDAALISGSMAGVPLAGFFAAGELGPVGPQNFIHGFTASLVLFSEG
ncbi:MAG: hypothetical protein EXS14_10105 [Planctomycetes bacterium]|nr:hypothetical protein [Planctomycetota bacterium]